MNKTFLDNIHAIHFIGIGGIGVSAIARMMLLRGVRVSGSDKALSSVTDRLVSFGARVFVGHNAQNIPDDVDAVAYSPAVSIDNPEIVVARARKIPAYSYPEMLGEISRGMRTVAVAGTHGKTTTTAMLADIFIETKKARRLSWEAFLKNGGIILWQGKAISLSLKRVSISARSSVSLPKCWLLPILTMII